MKMLAQHRGLPQTLWLCTLRYRGGHYFRSSSSRCSSPTIGANVDIVGSRSKQGTNNSTRGKKRPRVVVAMSGGVDSSVAAYLLQQQQKQAAGGDDCKSNGIDVIGLHMSNWNALDEDHPQEKKSSGSTQRRKRSQSQQNATNKKKNEELVQTSSSSKGGGSTTFCEASERDYNDALSVAQHLDNLPLHRVSFASEYWVNVFEPFVDSLSSTTSNNENMDSSTNHNNGGVEMPNPDFGCNTYIKFGAMKEYAMEKLSADYIATGHYAQLWHRNYTLQQSSGSSDNCNNFHEWMADRSRVLEQSVRESIAGRPEEEWILNYKHNNNKLYQDNKPMLLAGADRSKDQSYFLSGVKSEAFRNVIFPLGHLTKGSKTNDEGNNNQQQQSVRDIAHQAAIPTASKRDSMGICFIGKRNFGDFVSQYLPEPAHPGNFVDVDTGAIVGTHNGAMHYTIGQGAKISGASVRYFVCGKGNHANNNSSSSNNTVFVCNSTHHPALYTDELVAEFDSFNWIGLGGGGGMRSSSRCTPYDDIPLPLLEGKSIKLLARTRHLQPLASCTVTWERPHDTVNHPDCRKGSLMVHFDNPMRAITPGQVVALYAGSDGLICLGGGPIKGRGTSFLERGIDLSLTPLHPAGHNDLSLSKN